MDKRTDLAMEARELWQETAGKTTQLPGVRARERKGRGIVTTTVEILNQIGAQALGKPVGTYVTLELEPRLLQEPTGFSRAAVYLGKELARFVPHHGPVLVAGLGNSAVTSDAVGPKSLQHLVVTRHMGKSYPQLRPVSAIAPGVLGTTGLESVEVVRGVVERAKPACVVAVDALAASSLERLFTTVQIANTGIVPGSGVGNHQAAFDKRTLGVPVIAVGIPTVVEAKTLLLSRIQNKNQTKNGKSLHIDPSLIVTPRDADAKVDRAAKLLGHGMSLGLHRYLSLEDISCFTGS